MGLIRINKASYRTMDLTQAFIAYVKELRKTFRDVPLSALIQRIDTIDLSAADAAFFEKYMQAATAEFNNNSLEAAKLLAKDKTITKEELEQLRQAFFSLDNPYAQKFLPPHGAELVTVISDQTRAAIKAQLLDGYASGITGDALAKELNSVMGLNLPQSKALRKYRAQLVANGTPMDVVNKQTAKYFKKLLEERRDLIVRTEMNFAQSRGTLAAFNEASDRGFVPEGARKRWIAPVGMPNLCAICLDLHNVEVPLSDDFPGGYPGPPAHPACGCSVSLNVTQAPGKPVSEDYKARAAIARAEHNKERAAKRQRWRAREEKRSAK